MDKEKYYHRSEKPWTYQTEDDFVAIILRVGKSENTKINLAYGDPMFWGNNQTINWFYKTIKMKLINEDNNFKYYKAKFHTLSKRCRYVFEIIDVNCKSYMGERFFHNSVQDAIDDYDGITWGYINKANTFPIPSWYKGTMWYQIFIDRFYSTKKNNRLIEKNFLEEKVTDHSIYGGNIQGVIKKLDYIKELKFNGIYFTPIFTSPTSHKYDTINYLQIDPSFGTEKDFKKLIKEAHKRGIKIILDAVFNHIGWMCPQWQDVLKNKKKSKFKDWFFIKNYNNLKTPQKYYDLKENLGKTLPYEMFAFNPEMPRLNWNNKEVLNYLKKVVVKWFKMGIDGWRLDVSFEPTLNFWREIYRTAMKINPNSVIIGEVWWDSMIYMQGDMWHGVMNYPIRNTIIKYIEGKENLKTFVHKLNKHQMMYTPLQQNGMFNLITSHDTPRWITTLKENLNKYKIGIVTMYFIQGSTSIFYGEEIGLPGNFDPDCRRPMVWNKYKNDLRLFFKKLNKMKIKLNKYTSRDEHIIGKIKNNKAVFEYEFKNAKLIMNQNEIKVIINNKIYKF